MSKKNKVREPYFGPYKLYPHEVLEIRIMRRLPHPLTTREIAEGFGISASHVSNICVYRFWRDVP